jgi:hypothetical protein
MEPDPVPDHHGRRRKLWLVVFCLSLAALSVFWSFDNAFIYFTLALATFSLFKMLQLKWGETPQPHAQRPPFESSYESLKPSQAWIFWQDVKEIFRKDSGGPKTPQQGKVFVALVAGFIGFIFMVTILAALFGGNSGNESAVYYQQASDYYNAQQYDSAAHYYRLAIIYDPENPELYNERGNAFLNSNRPDSAMIMYDEALARNPQHFQAQYNKGLVYFNQKNYQQAISETKKIMAYNPGYNDAMLLIGDSFYNQSQLDSAMQWYEGAYANGYRSAMLCHLMAYICDVKGETPRAIGLYREAMGQDSSIVAIYTRLGELLPGEEGNWFRTKAAQMK